MTSEVGILGPFPMPDLERGLTDEPVCQVWIHGHAGHSLKKLYESTALYPTKISI